MTSSKTKRGKYKKREKPPKIFVPGELELRQAEAAKNVSSYLVRKHRRMLEILAERKYRIPGNNSQTIRLMIEDAYSTLCVEGKATLAEVLGIGYNIPTVSEQLEQVLKEAGNAIAKG